MKFFLLVSAAILNMMLVSCQPLQRDPSVKRPVIHSASPYIFFSLNAKWNIWDLPLSKSKDTLKRTVPENGSNLLIFTEKDTLAFKLNVNDTLRFSTVVNQKDTIKNVIIGLRKNASFSEEYKTRNKDRISVEIPNVSELANIMIAITDVGLRDSNMINLNNTYHADVVNWFLKFKKEPAIRFLDSIMNNTSNAGKYELYYTMKMYSTCYNMDTEGIFHRDSSILQMGYPKFFTAYDTHFASFQRV